MSARDLDSDSRLGAAIRAIAHGPASQRSKPIQMRVVSGDWVALYEIRLLTVRPKPQPKRIGGVLVIHPKRSAPGK